VPDSNDEDVLRKLLGRETISLDEEGIRHGVEGRMYLITGAAGSIGSELCRRVGDLGARRVVLLDHAESDLFSADQEIRRRHPDLDVVSVLADIRDARSVDHAVGAHPVDAILHAAAYKHVPMMERHVVEAAHNNIIGTWNLVQAARRHGVGDFLMISSDKAVRPASVMGASKRAAELVVSSGSGSVPGTRCASVRLGNVMGSRGSVVPAFREQIAAGGPVTVTHPEARRFFMSAREAALLILEASTLGDESGVFVVDMGQAVRILDLAHTMIRLRGLVPGADIEVRITGLRPGEKLIEDLVLDSETVEPTRDPRVRICRSSGVPPDVIGEFVRDLMSSIRVRDAARVVLCLRELVPEYRPGSGVEARPGRPVRASQVSAGP